jgi:retinoid X receptor alpha
VQEERQRNKEKNENEVESSTNGVCNTPTTMASTDMPVERILNAEMKVEQKSEEIANEVIVTAD